MSRVILFLLLFILCAATGAQRLQAQTRADSAAVLLHAAEQLRLRGEAGAARALLDFIERQYAGTAAAGEVARMRLAVGRVRDAERSGRTELILWGTTYGAWLGIAVPLALDADGPEAYGVGLLVGAPLAFLVSRAFVEHRHPTVGQSRAVTFGGSWGTYQGLAWSEVLDLGERREIGYCPPESPGMCYESHYTDEKVRILSSVVGGLAGIGVGGMLAQKPITAGTAAAVSSAALWGTWAGLALGVIGGAEDDALLTTTLLAGNGALVAAALGAPRAELAESRVRLVNVGGIIGGLAGLGVLLIAQPDDEKVAISIPLLGSAIGLGVGIATTADRDPAPRVPDEPGEGQGALLNVRSGHWAVGMPDATLRFARSDRGLRPAAYVPLLRARF